MLLSIGVDWGDQSHQVCIRKRADRRVLAEFEISHSAAGLERLAESIRALGTAPQQCQIAIETNQGLLVDYLMDQGYQLHPIPPAAVKPYRDRRRRTGAKSDRDDAQILSDILCQDPRLFPPRLRDSSLANQIRATYRARAQLVRQRTQVLNQLKSNLKSYFPLALKLFSGLECGITQAFLGEFPTWQAAQEADEHRLRSFFSQQGYKRPDRIGHILELLSTPNIPPAEWACQAGQRLTEALFAQLRGLCEHIAALEEELKRLLEEHPDSDIFLSLPRVGVVIAAGLLGEIGDCRQKFQRAGEIQTLAGTAPVTVQSSSSRKVRFRYACNKSFRDILQKFARQTALPGGSAWARGYLAAQIERGHSASRAYRALANRWVAIIFRMWQDGTIYQEDYHLKNIAKRQLAPTLQHINPYLDIDKMSLRGSSRRDYLESTLQPRKRRGFCKESPTGSTIYPVIAQQPLYDFLRVD